MFLIIIIIITFDFHLLRKFLLILARRKIEKWEKKTMQLSYEENLNLFFCPFKKIIF